MHRSSLPATGDGIGLLSQILPLPGRYTWLILASHGTIRQNSASLPCSPPPFRQGNARYG
ncbi:hypothetical protein [Trichothermofontia sp.]